MRAVRDRGAVASMTGFGQGAAEGDGVRVQVELKGVNHRFLDIKMKLPAEFAIHEPALRAVIQERVSRARLDIAVSVVSSKAASSTLTINRGLVREYLRSVDALRAEFSLEGRVGLENLLALPGVVTIQASTTQANGASEGLLVQALKEALEAYDVLRTREGEVLAADIIERLRVIREAAQRIEGEARGLPESYSRKIKDRVASLLSGERALDESRLAQEVALLAGRVDITEELVRLRGYLAQAEGLLARPDRPVGKTLDFIMQEMNREANTVSSKAEALPICQEALRIKAEVEKIREQAQNIE